MRRRRAPRAPSRRPGGPARRTAARRCRRVKSPPPAPGRRIRCRRDPAGRRRRHPPGRAARNPRGRPFRQRADDAHAPDEARSPSGDAVGAAGVDLDATVRVEIARDGGDDRRAWGRPESRVAVIPPRSIVHERDVRRRLLDQDDVRVAVGVEIGDDDAGRRARVGEADLRSERTERAVAVVVQELVPAVAFDQQQVEIAIVIGVEQRAVDGRAAAAVGVGGGGDVRPLTLRRLAPELIGALTTQIHVGEAVVVVVAPQRRGDAGHRRQRVRGVEHEPGRAAIDEHGVARGAPIVDRARDEQVDLSVAVDVRRRDARRMGRVEAPPGDGRRPERDGGGVEDRTGRSRRGLPRRFVDRHRLGERVPCACT